MRSFGPSKKRSHCCPTDSRPCPRSCLPVQALVLWPASGCDARGGHRQAAAYGTRRVADRPGRQEPQRPTRRRPVLPSVQDCPGLAARLRPSTALAGAARSERRATLPTLTLLRNFGIDPAGREQLADGGWNCETENGSVRASFATTICVLEGLLEHERATGGSAGVVAARSRGEKYLLERRLFRRLSTGEVVDPDWLRFSFPTWWHYVVLRALDYFHAAGGAPDCDGHPGLRTTPRGASNGWTVHVVRCAVERICRVQRVGIRRGRNGRGS